MAHVSRRQRSRRAHAWFLLAAGLTVLAVGILGWIGWFYWHYESVGRSLVREYTASTRSVTIRRSITSCAGAGSPPVALHGIYGVLVIPALGVRAPVENGDSESVLSDAVGHDPASSWPSVQGTSVLFAHDVTWFSGISKLQRGEVIVFRDACWSYTYAVSGHSIVAQGTELMTQATPTLYLVTCWPSDALFFTPQRYVLTARLVDVARSLAPLPLPSSAPNEGPLVVQGATSRDTLASNPTPLGYLTVTGQPSTAFLDGAQALEDVNLALEGFFARERAARLPAVVTVLHGLDVTLDVSGGQLVAAVVSDEVEFASGERASLREAENVAGNELQTTPLQVVPAANLG